MKPELVVVDEDFTQRQERAPSGAAAAAPAPRLGRAHALERLAACALCAFLATGCEPIAVTYTALKSPPKPMSLRTPESVEMYMTTLPERPYVEVATINVAKRHAGHSDADLMTALRAEGAARGCDAVVFAERNKVAHGWVGAYDVSVSQGTSDMTAACVVYKDAPEP